MLEVKSFTCLKGLSTLYTLKDNDLFECYFYSFQETYKSNFQIIEYSVFFSSEPHNN